MKFATVLSLITFVASSFARSDDGFISLFNGKDLTGWEGAPGLWKVEDGIVIGTCKGPDHFEHNTFLIWSGGTVRDFELIATVKMVGDNNSGIQYRSKKIPEFGPFAISGYQCDVHPALEHTGMTYEEKGRGIFGLNGKDVALDNDTNRWLLSEHEPVEADLSEWTEFRILVRGNHHIHQVNGKTSSELIDYDEDGRTLEGLIAIQLHRGNANQILIKEMKLKHLDLIDPKPLGPKALEGAIRIEKPRTTRPEGTGPASKRRAKQ